MTSTGGDAGSVARSVSALVVWKASLGPGRGSAAYSRDQPDRLLVGFDERLNLDWVERSPRWRRWGHGALGRRTVRRVSGWCATLAHFPRCLFLTLRSFCANSAIFRVGFHFLPSVSWGGASLLLSATTPEDGPPHGGAGFIATFRPTWTDDEVVARRFQPILPNDNG
jgi:hypothetical protein